MPDLLRQQTAALAGHIGINELLGGKETDVNGVNRRALYLLLKVDEGQIKNYIYVLVRSVSYLHNTTRARVFYNEQEAKDEVHSFNAAVSRASFHAYLFTFAV